MIEHNIKDEIKSRLKISEVISKSLSLQKKGENRFIALCPFHNEKTPSFNVLDDKGFYHCFGCGKSGDIFTFIMENENLTFFDALKYLSNIANISLQNKFSNKNISSLTILKIANNFFNESFLSEDGRTAQNYIFKERNIDRHICKEFMIGYAPKSGKKSLVIDKIFKNKFSADQIVESGFAKKSKEKELIYPYFINRLIFPIITQSGNVIGFGGRSLDNSKPKYLNSPESEFFKKRNILFGSYNAKRHPKKDFGIILCEGYMDVISLFKYGFPAVASLGTSITENQLEEALSLSNIIFLVLDGDDAGKNATIRAFDKILKVLNVGKIFKFVFLPDQLDPEEYINKYGLEEFNKKLKSAYSISDIIWFMGLKVKKNNLPESNANFWTFIRQKITLIKNKDLRLAIKDELEKRISDLRFQNRKQLKFNDNYVKKFPKLKLPSLESNLRYKAILILLINFPEFINYLKNEIVKIDFKIEKLNNIKDDMLKIFFSSPNITREYLKKQLHLKGHSNYLDLFELKNISSRILVDIKDSDFEKIKILLEELISMVNKKK